MFFLLFIQLLSESHYKVEVSFLSRKFVSLAKLENVFLDGVRKLLEVDLRVSNWLVKVKELIVDLDLVIHFFQLAVVDHLSYLVHFLRVLEFFVELHQQHQ